MTALKTSKNEKPIKRPSDPPTAATMAVKSKRRTSSTIVTSVTNELNQMEVRRLSLSSSVMKNIYTNKIDFISTKYVFPCVSNSLHKALLYGITLGQAISDSSNLMITISKLPFSLNDNNFWKLDLLKLPHPIDNIIHDLIKKRPLVF